MAPSTESRLPFEGLICPSPEIFPVAGSTSDDHHSFVLLIGGLQGGRRRVIDALFNVAVFAALALCIVGFGAWAHKRVDAQ
jgi:hypothetical protein